MSARLTIHDTGRRYFASSVTAFPRTTQYACAVERSVRSLGERIVPWACLAALLAFIVLVLGGWLPGGAR